MPIMSGLAIGALIGAGVGGASAALQHKDIGQGALYGGLMGAATGGIGGAMGGAGAAVGEGVVGSAVGDVAGSTIANVPINAGIDTLGSVGNVALDQAGNVIQPSSLLNTGAVNAANTLTTPGINGIQNVGLSSGQASPGFTGFDAFKSDPMKYLGENKMLLGAGAIGGSMANTNQPKGPDMGTIRPYQYTAGLNPGYTGSGTPYFNQSYKALPTYAAAEGGIVGLAGGGSAVSDYNNMLMQRAQQEYINSPQLPAFRSQLPVTTVQAAQPAPTAGGELTFDPVTRKYISAAAPKAEASGISSLSSSVPTGDNQVGGGGAANGGLMRYALGGGIGSNYGGPDTDIHYDAGGALGFNQGMQYPMQGTNQNFADGGISHLGDYSDGGRLLKGPGNGTSDDIPAVIGDKQPARLADGEFVVPSRIVSELGNGSTDAGAKQLYAMMDRVQAARRKTVGKDKVAFDAKARNLLPA